MNREIIFKAKRVDNGEWVEGSLIITEGSAAYIIRSKSKAFIPKGKNIICSAECYEINIETLCQYTGLTDKNGQKIWENDIVKFDKSSNYPIIWNEEYRAFGSYYYSDFDHLSKYINTEMEAVGNIFDNLDLLEVE